MNGDGIRLRVLSTAELTDLEVAAIRRLLWAAFETDDGGAFSEDDWEHAIGGAHVVLEVRGEIVAHAAVVPRELHLGGRPVRTGYVEAVATDPRHQRKGLGSQVMTQVASLVRDTYDLGALGTARPAFYERLGWLRWTGQTYVRTEGGDVRTPDEDGGILVLLTPTSPSIDLTDRISCDWRAGDVW